MKKNLATAMAAAMAFGAVVPAFAAEVETYALTPAERISLDSRLASGLKIKKDELGAAKVYKRTDVYNTNGTKDRSDDTVKSAFKDAKIVYSKQDATDSYLDQFILAEKETDIKLINNAKANVETAKAEIEEAKEKGASVVEKKTAAKFTGGVYTDSKITVTVTLKGSSVEYVFNGVEGVSEDTTVDGESLVKIFTDLNNKLTNKVDATKRTATISLNKTLDDVKANYYDMNLVKYTIEKNIAKFDVIVDEAGTDNTDLKVNIYVKDKNQKEENRVLTLTLKNLPKMDKKLIVNLPAKGDFTGHWAEKEIVDAMLKGQVDASNTFRPQGTITRGEFAKIACTLFGIDADAKVEAGAKENFDDVNSNNWYYKYVVALSNLEVKYTTDKGTAVKEGVIGGYGDDTFRADREITREEAATMIAKLSYIQGKSVNYDRKIDAGTTLVHTDEKTDFKDDKEIKTWADQSVKSLSAKKVIKGYDGNVFKPENKITRAEAIIMMGGASNLEDRGTVAP